MKIWLPLILIAILPAASAAPNSSADAGTAFITGSDRGIGFALVQEFESRGWQVIATTRGHVDVAPRANATDDRAIAKLSAGYRL